MFSKNYKYLFIFALLISTYTSSAQKNVFPIVTKTVKVVIVYDNSGPKLDSIAAGLLAEDIERVTSFKPSVLTDLAKAKGHVIVIGAANSPLVQKIAGKGTFLSRKINDRWECFALSVVDKPSPAISKALIIAGSDARGTAYGVFTLSEKIGVSPWYWWSDVPVKKRAELIITQNNYMSLTPAVKYRGIFINDEDWGLQPWAAKTFEPETGDIGPKTYAKVFELLLRLKANLIWPAMHPSTKAFFHYPGNVKTAADYEIILGSSHAEPMLRNNVGEWNEKAMGHFNYFTNKERIYKYWEDRVKQSSGINAIYTLGMRGVHDGQMEGIKDLKEAVPIIERIIGEAISSHSWIHLSKNSGILGPDQGMKQTRIWVDIDWDKLIKNEKAGASITFIGGDKKMTINVQAVKINKPESAGYKGFIENNGIVSMQAASFTRQTNRTHHQWKIISDFGYTGKVLQAFPLSIAGNSLTEPDSIKRLGALVEYDFYTLTSATPYVTVFALPTHPINNNYSLRYAVSIDNGPLKIVDIKTFGRSEEWKQNVLRNRVERKIAMPFLEEGKHTLKIYAVDPGLILDEIRIDAGGLIKAYDTIPETRIFHHE